MTAASRRARSRAGEPVVTVDAAADDRFRETASIHAMGLRSVTVLQIHRRTACSAALYMDNRWARALFDAATRTSCSRSPIRSRSRSASASSRICGAARELEEERRRVEELARGQALEIDRLQEEVREKQAALEHRYDFPGAIVGRSASLGRPSAPPARSRDRHAAPRAGHGQGRATSSSRRRAALRG
ncbi:MAG: hypothetical protein U0271_40780 [Polyangiaceae bacterium]